jgi:peroxin-11B
MRVGKFVEHFKAAAVASDAKTMDPVLRWTAVGRQLGYAGYMLFDNATIVSIPAMSSAACPFTGLAACADTMGQLDATSIRKFSSSQRLLREAYRAWFTGISFSIISSLYSLYQLQNRSTKISEKDGEGVVEKKKVAKEVNAVRVQLISDLCDITIPASALGWVAFDDGFVGLAGTLSSLLGVWTQWKKTA